MQDDNGDDLAGKSWLFQVKQIQDYLNTLLNVEISDSLNDSECCTYKFVPQSAAVEFSHCKISQHLRGEVNPWIMW